MGPPLPLMNPPPQGMRHCQRKVPVWLGLMKLNVSSEYAPPEVGVHGNVAAEVVHRVLRVGRGDRHVQVHARDRERVPHVAVRPRVDQGDGLRGPEGSVVLAELLHGHGVADGALDLAEVVVPQRRAAVETVDGHVDLRAGRDREQRRVQPVLGRRVLGVVGHPVRHRGSIVRRILLQDHVDLATGRRVVNGRQGTRLPDVEQGDEDSQPYHHDEGNEPATPPGLPRTPDHHLASNPRYAIMHVQCPAVRSATGRYLRGRYSSHTRRKATLSVANDEIVMVWYRPAVPAVPHDQR